MAELPTYPVPETVTFDDNFKLLDTGRLRVRALGTIVGSTSGFVTTIALALISYHYRGDIDPLPWALLAAIWVGIGLAIAAMVLTVRGFMTPTPEETSLRTKLLERMRELLVTEHGRFMWAARCLIAALIVLAVSVGWYVLAAQIDA